MKKLFQAYYRSHSNIADLLDSITYREFAFLNWNQPGMKRHIAYHSPQILMQDLIQNAPRHSYHSAAFYLKPGADSMDKKEYQGCEFIIDIDADHIPTNCMHTHNYNQCKKCGFKAFKDKPECCPECKNTKFDKIVWICDECLNAAKQQVFILVNNFLLKDFNITTDQLQLFFSGHRGYHIHIKTTDLHKLDQEARREIVDYVMGNGFSLKIANFRKVQQIMQGFSIDQIGWPGKIAQELFSILQGGEEFVKRVFDPYLNDSVLDILIKNRLYLINQLKTKNRTWQIMGFGEAIWNQIYEVLKNRIAANIDSMVSIDLHRLIRLENSLNGKTGFTVNNVSFENLREFNPLCSSLAFPNAKEMIKLKFITDAPKINLEGQVYGNFVKSEKVTLPLNAAMFFLCKDVADLDL